MDKRLYRFLVITATVMAIAWVGWSLYDSFFAHTEAGDTSYLAGERYFEDGRHDEAIAEYRRALTEAPEHIYAWRGLARAFMQLERSQEALTAFEEAIARAPEFAGNYSNRGILYDRMGEYDKALADYEQALRMDSKIAEGPGWLTRFLRLQPEAPPTIADRAQYLREQLAKPESERVLRIQEEDAKQRMYKQ